MTHVLIESGSHSLNNHGDTAMYVVAANRIRELIPSATIRVLTDNPARLLSVTPFVTPVVLSYPAWWSPLKQAVDAVIPPNLLANAKARFKSIAKANRATSFNQAALDTLAGVDIVVHTGMGGINNMFVDEAIRRLTFLGYALEAGKHVALFSQGMGPISSPPLERMCRTVLPHVGHLGIRETLYTPAVLTRFDVPEDKVFFSGDDALALVLPHQADGPRTSLGINLRLAPYAQLSTRDQGVIHAIKRCLNTFDNTPLIPFDIAEGDSSATSSCLGLETLSRGGAFTTHAATIKQIGRCRVVVTGSYHGAVFALGQGIPALCLARSEYYVRKFKGLAQQFSTGCIVVDLRNTDQLLQKLTTHLKNLWEIADNVEDDLLAQALSLVSLSEQSYVRWAESLS